MGWANHYIADLKLGKTVVFRPRGQSMTGRIESGQQCTVVPIGATLPQVGEIVLCRCGGQQFLHLVRAVRGTRFQISNNRGHINGWVSLMSIFGRCVKVEP